MRETSKLRRVTRRFSLRFRWDLVDFLEVITLEPLRTASNRR
jgi:hypothetical protein